MKSNESLNKIGIIGGGIIGLSMGNILQKRYPHANIQLICNRINKLTTSWGAPGFVRLHTNENKYEDSLRWCEKGMKHYWELYRSSDCVNAGITLSYLYQISDKVLELPHTFKDLFHGFREVNSKELAAVGFSGNMKYGVSFASLIIESRYYLPYLADKFTRNGGQIINETIVGGKQNVADWALKNEYDIVINCSGLGARELFNDHSVVPLRGQLVRVDAPWLKYSFVTSDSTYAFACRESVVLGGFRQKNDWDLSIRPEETKNILDRIRQHNVCLSESKIIEEWTGLRPFRENTRIESFLCICITFYSVHMLWIYFVHGVRFNDLIRKIEYIQSSNGLVVPVVHNYGHGSAGIGLSWGTSLEAVDLVDNVIKNFIRVKL